MMPPVLVITLCYGLAWTAVVVLGLALTNAAATIVGFFA